MFTTAISRRLAAMLLLALGVASCDLIATDAIGPDGTEQAAPRFSESQESIEVEGQDGETYELVEEPNLASEDKRVSVTIDHTGGTVQVLGHKLTVPAGAVTVPTVFTMIRLPNGLVKVELLAVQTSLLGETINIGEIGFEKPVTLELTYSRAENVSDPQDLVILRMNPKGTGYPHEVMPTVVDEEARTVRAQLDHFSGYCMAM